MTPIELTEENKRFVDDELAEGAFVSPDELINDALVQFRTYRNLMRRIEEGKQQLLEGRFLEVDEVGLKEFFDDVKARGRERANARNQTP